MDWSIRFPHLGIYLEHVGKNFTVFGISIAYYGVIIAVGMLAGILLATYEAKRTGQNPDDYFDLAIIAIICSVIGARLYYVIFSWDLYKDNLWSILNLRQGGLAIYGGVIAAIITAVVFAKVKGLSFPRLADTAGLGLILGQIIGRWGNFFNREAFGGYTDGLLAMQLPVSAVRDSDISKELAEHIVELGGVSYIQVHPTFLYESLWNLVLLVILLLIRKRKKFEGEIFLLYLAGYGIGRAWIEGLRTDQLLIPGTSVAVSQVLAVVLAVVSVMMLIILRKKAVSRKQQ
ncbi:MAG: prolipoprotein diacylglyceryl transferase [Lachnospiraceae bacterium]|jgi:prolipoprotein diacylglyceryl transferase|nr:prolipoprotein diacylglyceryl transferase [Lachnospiraceae bacterium]MEE0513186.1 prolipoprotein diacylglyceryl transferase [Lachnospiraceae bacterium]